MRTISQFLALIVAILSFGTSILAQTQTRPDATRILNNMFRVYSRAASYQDEGILVTTTDTPTGGTIEKIPFKTFFKRPNLFRFEWTEFTITKLGRTYRIWFNGKEAFTYWEPDRYEKDESLGLAVAGATGVSSRTVNTVSDMLLPDELGPSTLKRLAKVSLAGEDVFEGINCYRIKATEGDESIELWIAKKDFFLHKLRREKKSGDELRIREEMRRNIQVDQSISENVFNYKPPIALTPRKEIDDKQLEKLLNPGPPVWSEFKSDEGGFSVLMPEKPVSQASTFETSQGRFEQHMFIASHSPFSCMVAYSDFPQQSMVATNVDSFFDGVQDQFTRLIGGKLATQTSISLDGHSGREIKVQLFRGELRVRMFLVGGRMYLLSFTKFDRFLESDLESLNKFFGSFKLNTITKPIAALHRGTALVF